MSKQPSHKDQIPLMPTDKQIASACFAYRHDFGLLPPEEKAQYHLKCKLWWAAIAKEINQPSEHPFVIDESERMTAAQSKPKGYYDAKSRKAG